MLAWAVAQARLWRTGLAAMIEFMQILRAVKQSKEILGLAWLRGLTNAAPCVLFMFSLLGRF
jgi:hypothetical protein